MYMQQTVILSFTAKQKLNKRIWTLHQKQKLIKHETNNQTNKRIKKSKADGRNNYFILSLTHGSNKLT